MLIGDHNCEHLVMGFVLGKCLNIGRVVVEGVSPGASARINGHRTKGSRTSALYQPCRRGTVVHIGRVQIARDRQRHVFLNVAGNIAARRDHRRVVHARHVDGDGLGIDCPVLVGHRHGERIEDRLTFGQLLHVCRTVVQVVDPGPVLIDHQRAIRTLNLVADEVRRAHGHKLRARPDFIVRRVAGRVGAEDLARVPKRRRADHRTTGIQIIEGRFHLANIRQRMLQPEHDLRRARRRRERCRINIVNLARIEVPLAEMHPVDPVTALTNDQFHHIVARITKRTAIGQAQAIIFDVYVRRRQIERRRNREVVVILKTTRRLCRIDIRPECDEVSQECLGRAE